MSDPNAEVREAAFRTLVDWPEVRAGAPLLRFAETNAEPNQAVVALRDGCLRLSEMDEIPAEDRAAILKGVIRVAKRPEEKRRAVTLMGQVPSVGLLETLTTLTDDDALRAEAIASATQLARSLGAVYPKQSLAALDKVKTAATTPELRKKVEDSVRVVRNAGQSPEGYILGWFIAGPYTAADKDGPGLFDVPFPPEQPDAKADWRPVSAPVTGMVDLAKGMAGENRVGYLRTIVTSESDQAALLELGTDDGVKVWLNGQVVHGNNTVRACTPAQDKVKVQLRKGENNLLLKVTQGGGEWSAITRIVGPDGKLLPDILVGTGK
jgi:hypothetical protein